MKRRAFQLTMHVGIGPFVPISKVHFLRDIARVLADQMPSSLDRLGRERTFYAAEATRWHGARDTAERKH